MVTAIDRAKDDRDWETFVVEDYHPSTVSQSRSPAEFNEQFAIGLTYLLQKDLEASKIAADPNINSVKEWSNAMQQWMKDNPPPEMFSDVYNYNYLEDLNLDLNLRPLVEEES